MTGVKNLVAAEDALLMHLPKNKAKAKYLRVEINADDTYNMIFRTKAPNFAFPVVAEFDGIYFDQLQEIFTEVTGLYTRL